jgi:hypothetical protein
MTDDIVKRLREYRIGCGIHCSAYDAREPLDECIEAADRIEKLESALRNVAVTLDSEEIPYMVRNRYACATAKEALEAL